jgi:signal transduction histidine kinase
VNRYRNYFVLVGICFCLQTIEVWGQHVRKGTADFSTYHFDEQGPILLSGQWEFYWNKLLSPIDFKDAQPSEWIHVPDSWHRQKPYPPLGYATYRVHLRLPENQKGLCLYFPIINASAKIWMNDILVGETGKVNADPAIYQAGLLSTIVPLPDNTDSVSIIIQVANFSYFSGGLNSMPRVDYSSKILARLNTVNGIENFFAGSLLALFIYQIILFLLFYRGKPYLWLSLICLGVALRAMIVHGGSFLLPNLLPFVDWEYWKKIEFGCVYAIVALFPLYVYHLFPAQASRKLALLFVIVSAFLLTAVIFTPQYVYGRLLDVCHAGLLLAFVYAFYSISRAWKAGNKDAKIILFGVLASFPFILAEILRNSLLHPLNINFMFLVEIGVLVFLLFQVYLLANHYAQSYRNLETLNQDLEKRVEERTSQLKKANTVRDKLLSVMSHDIKSPLNSLRGILQVFNMGAIDKDEFKNFSRHIEGDLWKTNLLVENILLWTASQLKGIQVKKESFDLSQLIEENKQLFQTIASNKGVSFVDDSPEKLQITADRNILNLVLRNLLSNAIKFSFEGSKIDIHVSLTNQLLLIQVKDEGVGMDEETQERIMAPQQIMSTSGTENEKGTGLGLALCRDYLSKAGGQLTINSKKGEGSTFSILIEVD